MKHITRYERRSGDPKWNAQQNLEGRSHYVDDDTLRYHKSRILQTYVIDEGLLFSIIESVATNYKGTARGFRHVTFDLFGHVVSSVDLENTSKTSRAAIKVMWDEVNKIDAKSITLEACRREQRLHKDMIACIKAELKQ